MLLFLPHRKKETYMLIAGKIIKNCIYNGEVFTNNYIGHRVEIVNDLHLMPNVFYDGQLGYKPGLQVAKGSHQYILLAVYKNCAYISTNYDPILNSNSGNSNSGFSPINGNSNSKNQSLNNVNSSNLIKTAPVGHGGLDTGGWVSMSDIKIIM